MAEGNINASSSRLPQCLSHIPVEDLTNIEITVRRRGITTLNPPVRIERSIDDPKLLSPFIHFKQAKRGIFDRDDILVNQDESFSERQTVRYRAYHSLPPSRVTERSHSRSPKRDKRVITYKNVKKKCADCQRSYEEIVEEEERRLSTGYSYSSRLRCRHCDGERHVERLVSPLRPGERDLRHREQARDRYDSRRSRSLSPKYDKPSTSTRESGPSRSTSHKRIVSQIQYGRDLTKRGGNYYKSRTRRETDRELRPSSSRNDSMRRRSRSLSRNRSRSLSRNCSRSLSQNRSRSLSRNRSRSPSSKEQIRSRQSSLARSDSGRHSSRSPERRYHKYRRRRSRSPREKSSSRYEYKSHPQVTYSYPDPTVQPGFSAASFPSPSPSLRAASFLRTSTLHHRPNSA